MRLSTLTNRIMATTAVAALLAVGGASAAHSLEPTNESTSTGAEERAIASVEEITIEDLEVFRDELRESGVSSTTFTDEGTALTTFHLPGGLDMTFPDEEMVPETAAPGVITPMVSGGWGILGPYVDLSPADQNAMLQGSLTGISGMVCALAPVSCPVVGVVIAVGLAYLSEYDACPNGQDLRVWIITGGAGRPTISGCV